MQIFPAVKALCMGVTISAAAFLSGNAAARSLDTAVPEIPEIPVKQCAGEGLTLDTGFPAGNIESCEITGKRRIAVTIAPEDAPPINCSAWYAFRLQAERKQKIRVTLSYTHCGHRYWPKVSHDGVNWEYLPASRVKITEFAGKKQAEITVSLEGKPLFVAAQEIIVPSTYDAWLKTLASEGRGTPFELGLSAENRPIPGMQIGNAEAREQIILVGRQHPPEITGALAMFPFVETIAGDTDLAKRFRARFNTIMVPMLNPDGVVRGHWRHNTGGVDLNRDWGPFTQPETKLMQGILVGIAENPAQDLRLVLDFHSTNEDVFYTIPDELPTDPPLFTRDWLARYQELMPNYEVNRDARHEVGRPISKAHAFDQYGVPAVTFELGDETDRELIRTIGEQSAIAMMETLLATPAQ